MYHGRSNFGCRGPFIVNSYDYDASIHEYRIFRNLEREHLKEYHKAIEICVLALVIIDPKYKSLGPGLEPYLYPVGPGICATFLANIITQPNATVKINGNFNHLTA